MLCIQVGVEIASIGKKKNTEVDRQHAPVPVRVAGMRISIGGEVNIR
jgi:hypothetical protein